MARKENQLETVQITISTTQQVLDLLRALVDTGLYGKNAAEAAERLLAQSLSQLIHEQRLSAKKKQ